MSDWFLAGDVGGTKINLALFRQEAGRLAIGRQDTFATQGSDSLAAVTGQFLGEEAPAVVAACFGVPGPAGGDRVEGVNLPWVVDRIELRETLKIPRVELINDLVAAGYGLNVLPPESFAALNDVAPNPEGNATLVAAGTGLGETLLVREGGRWRALPSEGGHAGFAPASEIEIDLLRYLMRTYGHVSFERVLSGPGLYNIYRFLRDSGRGKEPPWLAERLMEDDPGAAISRAAAEGNCPICEQALDLFVAIYGTEAGNMALKILATGGVFLGGGIAPRILERLKGETFRRAFRAMGRMTDLMDKFPVKVVLDSKAALYGAAHYASLGADAAGGKPRPGAPSSRKRRPA
ncbi:MAG: glucokinase [bacterium]|nr:glucokinase [bacterium]